MIKPLQSRQEKIKFLKELEQGKESIKAILRPITGMIILHNGEVVADIKAKGIKSIKSNEPKR